MLIDTLNTQSYWIGRIYPREVMEKAISDKMNDIKQRKFVGIFIENYDSDQRYSPKIDISDVSHLFLSAYMNDREQIEGDIEILQTEKSNRLNEYMKYHPERIRFFPRGIGKVGPDNKTVTEFELISIDAYLMEV